MQTIKARMQAQLESIESDYNSRHSHSDETIKQ